MPNKEFWKDKTVLITGHRGFIGSWLARALNCTEAKLIGADINNSRLYRYFDFGDTGIANIQNKSVMEARVNSQKPDIIFHLAAQPIVSTGEYSTLDTFMTNVIGTSTLLQVVEQCSPESVFVHMSTDKVYAPWSMPDTGFVEESMLGSDSPYACSKICAEDVVNMYRERGINTVTVRAGNVFGGGDFESSRLVPTVIQNLKYGRVTKLRNADGSRPYQYVLNVVYALLTLAEARYSRELRKPWYNVGVDTSIDNYVMAERIAKAWGAPLEWEPFEASYRETCNLLLDCTAYNKEFGKLPFSFEEGVEKTVQVYKDILDDRVYHGHDLFKGIWK